MMRRAILFFVVLAGCHRAADTVPESVGAADASADARIHAADASVDASVPKTTLLADDEVGALVAKLSESPGDFPSENYVTNETSLLHVASALRDPKIHGRAYVGVGPEQSYTYLALLEPKIAYIVDIRRNNLLEHMVFRGCFEAGSTRAAFLAALLARAPKELAAGEGFAPVEAAFHGVAADAALRDAGVARTKAVMDRLAVKRAKGDDQAIARIHEAFAKNGLSIAYTMLNSGRKYPTLGENFAALDPDGKPGSFLGSEEIYGRVRTLVLENRVIPVVGDFGAKHALRAVAADMRARNLELGVFYTSNVEQYLFEQKTYPELVASVDAMPHDEHSRFVRVWFDQGQPHPAQQKGHRTTQLVFSVNTFLERNTKKPFRSYDEVVRQKAE